MARLPVLVCLSALIVLAGPTWADEKPQVVDLWPGAPPGEAPAAGTEQDTTKPTDGKVAGRSVIRLGQVSRPSLTFFRPSPDKDTRAAVVIAPGGGYHILAWDLEGEEVARWLNGLGVTGIVLKYRVPRRPSDAKDQPPPAPLQDAQRAIRLVRSRAKEWGLDPGRIGMLGFSAGGHLTAAAATGFERKTYPPADEVDKESCRPDFVVLVYPAYLVNKDKTGLNPDVTVTPKTPPMFLVHAGDDPVPAENSVQMYLALKKAGVPADLHVFARGGHGYGLRPTDVPVTRWPSRCEDWMRNQGLLPGR